MRLLDRERVDNGTGMSLILEREALYVKYGTQLKHIQWSHSNAVSTYRSQKLL